MVLATATCESVSAFDSVSHGLCAPRRLVEVRPGVRPVEKSASVPSFCCLLIVPGAIGAQLPSAAALIIRTEAQSDWRAAGATRAAK